MIYLNAEVVSGLGEDTFWTWFKREFPASRFGLPQRLQPDDIILQYSTLGFANRSGKSLAILWELLPQMKEVFHSNEWDAKLAMVYECARFSTWRTTPTALTSHFYEAYGSVDVLPIGVDTDLFAPLSEKGSLRDKYGIPAGTPVGVWVGTTHPMKGFPALEEAARRWPETHWIVIWKQPSEAGHFPGASNFIKVSQQSLCELFNCADFYLSTSLLPSFYMAEWEAMSCNIPVRIFEPGIEKDFRPSSTPRDDVFRLRWDRASAKAVWADYLENKGVRWHE